MEAVTFQLAERDRLIAEHNLILVGGEKEDEEEEDNSLSSSSTGGGPKQKQKATLITKEAADILKEAGEGTLDAKLKKLSDEKQELVDQLHRLKLDYEEEKARNTGRELSGQTTKLNGPDSQIVASAQSTSIFYHHLPLFPAKFIHDDEISFTMRHVLNFFMILFWNWPLFFVAFKGEAAQKVNEMKNKLQKAEQDNSTLQATINRLEGQVIKNYDRNRRLFSAS